MATKNLGTTGVLYTDRRDFYPTPYEVAEDYASQTPFLSMLSAKGPKQVTDPDFKMFEYSHRFLNPYITINEPSTVASWSNNGEPGDTLDAVVDVDGANNININSSLVGMQMEVYDSTYATDPASATKKGHVLCTAYASNQVTLKSLGNEEHASFYNSALADNDVLVILGPAGAEGGSAFEADNDELTVVWNSTQDFRTSVKVTKTLQRAALRGERDDLARERMARWQEHKSRIDFTLWRGIRASGTGMGSDSTFIDHTTDASGDVVRTTMGLATAVNRYGATAGDDQGIFPVAEASYTWSDFVDDMEQAFRFNPGGTLTGYAGPKFLSWLAKVKMNGLDGHKIELSDFKTADKLSIRFRELETEHGMIRVVPTFAFQQGPLQGDMYLLDDDCCDLRNHEEANAFFANILRDDNPRVIKDEYYSNLGLGIRQIKKVSRFRLA